MHSPNQLLELREAFAQATVLVVLVTGEDTSGDPFWAFVQMNLDGFAAFEEAAATGGELSDYGTILEMGSGKAPPSDIAARMARDFDFNPQLATVSL